MAQYHCYFERLFISVKQDDQQHNNVTVHSLFTNLPVDMV